MYFQPAKWKEGNCPKKHTETATVVFEGKTYTDVYKWSVFDHEYGVWYMESYPTVTENGSIYRLCKYCGHKDYDIVWKLGELSFAGASLTLYDNISIKYMVKANQFIKGAYSDAYVQFEMNGVETKVTDYTVQGDYLIFEFTDIAPHQMTDIVYATLYGTFDGIEYESEPVEYSIIEYCYNMLDKYADDCEPGSEIETLLVDLLIYGAKSQIYMNYKVDNLADAQLGEEHRAMATKDRELVSVLDQYHTVIPNPTARWRGASLSLNESITMRFVLDIAETEGVTVEVASDVGTWTILPDAFEKSAYGYDVLFNGLNAAQLSVPVYITAYKNGEAISNTICYSVESYAKSKENAAQPADLAELVKAMMRYGDSAYQYVN